MDQALKQRLVGATVLIALGVIFLPVFIGGGNNNEPFNQGNDEFLIPPQPVINRSNDDAGDTQPGRRLPLVSPSSVPETVQPEDTEVNLTSGELRLPLPEQNLSSNTGDSPESVDQSSTDQNNASNTSDAVNNRNDSLAQTATQSTSNALDDLAEQVQNQAGAQVQTSVESAQEQSLDDLIQPFVTQPATSVEASNQSQDLSGQWRLQVASLGNPDNAQRLIGQLQAGYGCSKRGRQQ